MAAQTEPLPHMVTGDIQFDSIVLGLGKTGVSCARFLSARGQSFAIADTREQPPEMEHLRQVYPDVPVYLGPFDARLFSHARQLILSPGVSQTEPAIRAAVDSGVVLAGDIELFARHAAAPIVAITGSNGKSTVATLVAAMIERAGCQVRLGGNIGTPALDLLAEAVPDFYVLELSSFQLETVESLYPAVAVVLNVSADHMDRYPDLAAYAATKQHIYQGAASMVINLDDPVVRGMQQQGRECLVYSLTADPGEVDFGLLDQGGEAWLARRGEPLLPAADVHLPGRHNIANVLASLALGTAIGLPEEAMLQVVQRFPGLPHRCQRVACAGDVIWIDDSKGTNIGAACAAIDGLGGHANLVLIAGGDGKAADFSPLAEAVRGRVHTAILIGRDAPRLAKAIEGETRVMFATDMQEAVNSASRVACPGDTVLLSPACASLDMFRDYRQRGEAFAAAIRSLGSEEAAS